MSNLTTLFRFASAAAILAAGSTASLFAQEHVWVDPVSGSNSAAGTSEAEAWRTLRYALANAPTFGTVHMLPGSYGLASGETFPLVMHRSMTLVGEGQASDVVIDGSGVVGGAILVVMAPEEAFLRRFTVDGAGDAAFLVRMDNTVCYAEDVHATRGRYGFYVFESSMLTLDQCSATNNSIRGAQVRFQNSFIANDSTFRSNGGDGVASQVIFVGEVIDIELNRCRVMDNGGSGVLVSSFFPQATSTVEIRNCLVARNLASGVSADGLLSGVKITGCTIAHNVQWGIFGIPQTLRNSLIAMNSAGDVSQDPGARWCFTGDGSLSPSIDNLSGDPRFVDPAADDFRLRFDSPCVDTGQYLGNGSGVDGYPFAVDGDLDLMSVRDIGAIEHRTLTAPDAAAIGDSITLHVSGPVGGFSTVVANDAGYAAVGATTPYGRFFLPAAGSFRLAPVMTTGGAPSPVAFDVPMDPALVGTSMAFQALTRSSNAPANAAFSNPVLVSIGG